ncbi:hypothetical protein XELAEV_18013181mg [Xenopus laevis]|uniref:Secreted protein n=1 Tax=Xenopus laevis TaxID=8355 RepID=A0A974HZ61_XENLA|nr:hypothetical protein XELAEV_18013181mg [Xenopus laevis]
MHHGWKMLMLQQQVWAWCTVAHSTGSVPQLLILLLQLPHQLLQLLHLQLCIHHQPIRGGRTSAAAALHLCHGSHCCSFL